MKSLKVKTRKKGTSLNPGKSRKQEKKERPHIPIPVDILIPF
jgi:hypothetical protein